MCGSTARFISHYLRPPAGLNSHHSSAGFILPAKIGIYNHHNKVVMSRGPVRIQYNRGPKSMYVLLVKSSICAAHIFLGCPEECSILIYSHISNMLLNYAKFEFKTKAIKIQNFI